MNFPNKLYSRFLLLGRRHHRQRQITMGFFGKFNLEVPLHLEGFSQLVALFSFDLASLVPVDVTNQILTF